MVAENANLTEEFEMSIFGIYLWRKRGSIKNIKKVRKEKQMK
jgi:hypothetical protein